MMLAANYLGWLSQKRSMLFVVIINILADKISKKVFIIIQKSKAIMPFYINTIPS